MPDYLSLSVIARVYRRDPVDEVIAETRSKEKRTRLPEGIAVEGDSTGDVGDPGVGSPADRASVYGDNTYGTGVLHERLERAGIESKCKTQQPVAKSGMLAKDRFILDLDRDTVQCSAWHTTPIRRASNGAGNANFWPHCTHCPLGQQCTTAPDGRTVSVGIHERHLADARARPRDPGWVADYRATPLRSNARSPT